VKHFLLTILIFITFACFNNSTVTNESGGSKTDESHLDQEFRGFISNPSLADITQVAAGYISSCSLRNNGRVRCWGGNGYGILGLNSKVLVIGDDEHPSYDLNFGDFGKIKATQVVMGTHHACILLDTGDVRCWGNGNSGALGLGRRVIIGDDEFVTENVNLGGVKATQITAGKRFTCALLETGNVRCWGNNYNAPLGLPNTVDVGRTDFPTQDVNLGGASVTQIDGGDEHVCAVLTTGGVRCWGNNQYGQLGIGDKSGDNYLIGDNEHPTVDVNLGGESATQVAAGAHHSCALLTSGDVRCWGRNVHGNLGINSTETIGDNEDPTVNVTLGGATVTQISAGQYHTCALLATKDVRCWGSGSYGVLGRGDVENIGDNESLITNVNLAGAKVAHIDAGSFHTCTALTTGKVRCWGRNNQGQLGIKSTSDVGDNELPTQNIK
tara:strand:+ start:610 stop:1929 length:1320 start_codon:yes stop_codon:yes gene_type:complete